MGSIAAETMGVMVNEVDQRLDSLERGFEYLSGVVNSLLARQKMVVIEGPLVVHQDKIDALEKVIDAKVSIGFVNEEG